MGGLELGRIDPAAFDRVDFIKIDVEGAEQVLAYADVAKARGEIEFNRKES